MTRNEWELGWLNMLSYFVLTWDIRTVAQGDMLAAAIVSMIVGILTVTIFKRLQDASLNVRTCLIYACFGTVGTEVGIVLSQHVLGH